MCLMERHVRGDLTRREFLLRGLAIGASLGSLAALLDAAGAPAAAAGDVNVLGWGGSYQDAIAKWVTTPFQTSTGLKVNFQGQGFAAQSLARIEAEKAKPTLDIWLTTTALPLRLAKEGLLQELTVEKVPNLAGIAPVALQKYESKIYAAGIHLNVNLIIVDNQRIRSLIPNYNISMLRSWTFLYRAELKDQVGIPGFKGEYGASMIGVSKAYGGSEYDEDKFFAAMRKLAPNIHMTKTSAVGWVQPFLSKEVVAVEAAEVDATAVLKAGASVDIVAPIDPLTIALDYVVAIKNGPAGPDAAFKYINQMLDPATMGPYCRQIGIYSPNRKAIVAPAGMPIVTASQLAKGWVIDYDAALAHYDSWNERFNKEIVPLFGK
jgi:putative spermidine/putrescine transport system substrate-binding protein